jgi:soluble cytochrome b562
MKPIRTAFLPVLLLASAAGAATLLSASAATHAPRPVEGGLEEPMQTLQAGVKSLDKTLEKKEVDKSLATVRDMQKAAHEAKQLDPPKAGEIADPKEKAELLKGYRLKLIDLERGLLDVEAALIEGKPEDAKKALDARVKATKKEGHDKYKD